MQFMLRGLMVAVVGLFAISVVQACENTEGLAGATCAETQISQVPQTTAAISEEDQAILADEDQVPQKTALSKKDRTTFEPDEIY